ncbi:hypothetical protein SAMN05660420_01583 [Desulfuromusa kysingii]|uniref:Uncharacterized protein n=1 Tax=Desulfuromusa kysingii TaxID=37625 RepID=A0A1H3ZN36_9BACT|nr:hypothetical protein [Desulfuromusa kysingii]SEA24642.1 hypothetical protein SAMN05660420_01583 [Desulfuromusa kysingii]
MFLKNVLFGFLILAITLPAYAQNTVELKKQLVLGQKKLNVMENMSLSESDAAAFWPIYDEFQEEIFELDQQRYQILTQYTQNYKTLTDEQADRILDSMFEIKDQRQSVLKRVSLSLEEVLPAKIVFRYLQIENNMATLEAYSLIEKIPLLE